ncbi:MAG: class I SAM-dependent methyltransferase [Halorhodospira sp.]
MRGLEHIPWLYDLGMAIFEPLGLGRWRDCLVAGARGQVLEVGCGTGRTLPSYPKGTTVWGVDPDAPALRRAHRRAPQAPLSVARAEALPFPDHCFDTVVTSLSFCSVADVPQGLAELHRVLRQAGELRMLEHVRSPGLAGHIQDRLQPAWTTISGGCHLNRDTEAAVTAAGFRIDPESRRARGVMRCFAAHKADG